MNRLVLAALLLAAVLPPSGLAAVQPVSARPADFDVRQTLGTPGAALTADQIVAKARLHALVPGSRVDIDRVLGSPAWVVAPDGNLGGPSGKGRRAAAHGTGPSIAPDPHGVLKVFLDEHRRLFRHGSEVLDGAVTKHDYVTPRDGLHTTVWKQVLNGIPVFEALLVAHVTQAGDLMSVSSRFVPDPARAADTENPRHKALAGEPAFPAYEAALRAVATVGEEVPAVPLELIESAPDTAEKRHEFRAGHLPGTIRTSLTWLPLSSSRLRLCWAVQVSRRYRGETFLVLIDAQTGETLLRRCLTLDLSGATYRVFTAESPTPLLPGWSNPNTNQPPPVARSLVTLPALSTNASPLGWINDVDNETRGNNVDAHLDWDADNLPDLPRPQGSPYRVFDFPLDLGSSPTSYGAAAVVQLFYWCNWMHDRLYELGFTEALGNFQKDNLGRGGLGGDPVLADAQDGSGYNNANFTPMPEGQSPRIQMYLFNGASPARDGDLDATVVLHEYTHGLSDRLIGGGAGISQLQTYGLAEGWSDFYALALLSNPADPPDSCYPMAAYVSYLLNGAQGNYYFGLRRYPVTTDLAKSPLTFKDVDPGQASPHAGIPRNPIISSNPGEVHMVGEVWCAMLWEARARMIQKYGPVTGSDRTLRLVTEGLRVSPPNPTFTQARDAILQADLSMFNGTNRSELWAAFAKRGLGYSAAAPDNSTTLGVQEAFDLPASLLLSPSDPLAFTGPTGGPFAPVSRQCSLINAGAGAVSWVLNSAPSWMSVSPGMGVVPPFSSSPVTFTVNSLANSLAPGLYSGTAVFQAPGNSQHLTASVILQVTDNQSGHPDFLNEIFTGKGDFDLDYATLTFTPAGDTNTPSYTACLAAANAFPTDPTGGEVIPLVDDSYRLISLSEGQTVSLYGTRTNQVLIGSNGDLVLGVPANYVFDPARQLYTEFFHADDTAYFSLPRVAPLYADLNPGVGGEVSWMQLSNRLVVTWQDVPEYGLANHNSFQAEWFFDGTIRFTWAGVDPAVGANLSTPKVGLVNSGGMPTNFVSTDFSINHSCLPEIGLLLPAEVTEGQGPWAGVVMLAVPSPSGTTVAFACSETNAHINPSTVDIAPGEASATFTLQVDDDHRLRGTRTLNVTATAAGYNDSRQTVLIDDATVATLTVSIPPKAREAQGLISGTIAMDAIPEVPISVQLASSDPALLRVPSSVQIPAGTNVNGFDLWVADDHLITGPVAVAVTAHVPNWNDDADGILISDNESTNLTLSLPGQVLESAGLLAKVGQVTLSGYLLTNLTVLLSCDNTNLVQLPPAVTIEAGQLAASFDATVLENPLPSPPQYVKARASATGFGDGVATMVVIDNDTPSVPTNPSPAHLATRVSTAVTLSWTLSQIGFTNELAYDVYLGTNSALGPAQLQGSTSTNFWPLTGLATSTPYYWQVVVRSGAMQVAGPVWQFTTASLNRFVVAPVSSPQLAGSPFAIAVTALDELGQPAVSFAGPAGLSALTTAETGSSIVITEVASSGFGRIELANVSAHEVDLSGWQAVFYDGPNWPAPAATFLFPEWNFSPPGGLFQIRKPTTQVPPGSYPTYYMTNALGWNNNPFDNPLAVLLLDRSSNVVDFMCAVDADPARISAPLPLPPGQWSGPPAPANLTSSFSYQRLGASDRNTASDWFITTNSLGRTNSGLTLPFRDPVALAVSPPQLLSFSNGVWSGNILLQAASTNVLLKVEDAEGHFGMSNPFAVGAPEDISLGMSISPGRPIVALPFTYTLTVSNTGPSAATGVVLLDNLPPQVDFLGATNSQGTVTYIPNTLISELGTIGGGSAATVTITLVATADGVATNRASIWRAETETYTANNTNTLVTTVGWPRLSISDTNVPEGNSGTNNFLVFRVSLSDAGGQTVTVGYSTAPGTATPNIDYMPVSGVLVFPPGTTNLTISVPVVGNPVAEANETVFMNLSNATQAVISRSSAQGTIVNDDTNPYMSISDATVTQVSGGLTNALFSVTLSTFSDLLIAVYWSTTDGTAVAGLDYLPGSGWLYFQPGETQKFLSVTVPDNPWYQPTRTFSLDLAYPFNAIFSRYHAVGTILDDDAWRFHHFAWALPAVTQYVHEPFPVTITAQNALNQTVADYDGVVAVDAGYSNRLATVGVATNQWEFPFGAYYLDTRLQALYPASAVGPAGRLCALSLDVAARPGQVLSNWTIRLAQSPLTAYSSASWATNWVVVHQSDLLLVSTGWVTFQFQTPFDYDGTSSLLVDLSFRNSSYSSDGLCRASMAGQPRSLYFRTDGAFGDPLQWAGSSNPTPLMSAQYPNARFSIEAPASVTPTLISNFVDGVWSGLLTFNEPGAPMVLRATDAHAFSGTSGPMTVTWRDSDSDGMPDEWEIANHLRPVDPSDANLDPDGDGLTNLQEYQAGTDPHDPDSTLKILSISWVNTNALAVSFASVTNRHYVLESGPGLFGMAWAPASPVVKGRGSVMTLTNLVNPGSPAGFLRVRASF